MFYHRMDSSMIQTLIDIHYQWSHRYHLASEQFLWHCKLLILFPNEERDLCCSHLMIQMVQLSSVPASWQPVIPMEYLAVHIGIM